MACHRLQFMCNIKMRKIIKRCEIPQAAEPEGDALSQLPPDRDGGDGLLYRQMFTGHYSLTHRHICKMLQLMVLMPPSEISLTLISSAAESLQEEKLRQRSRRWQFSKVSWAKNIQIWIQKRSGGSVTANSVTSRQQQPPPQYSMTPMQQQYQQGQGAPHQFQGYNVDHRLQEQGQYRGQYQGRVQSRPFDQQEGVWEKYCSLETTTIWNRSLWIWF